MLWSSCLFAQVGLLSPSDPIIGGQVQGTDFVEGSPGFGANQWPFAETPVNAIDGVGQKYLNFGELNTGFIVTPSGGSSIATGLQLWTANDAEERDPASYEIWVTNSPIAGGTLPLSDFTQISTGALNLPASRNAAGDAPLLVENSDTVLFANTTN
ncbi:MAG: LamG domain-containing protein, partial [Planctomycetota bacterium]